MNIQGLDYNTQREQLILPEYGREIQSMVDHALSLPDKAERQRCAESIVTIMERMVPQNRESENYRKKLWDHLAIMSNFQLDIDWPFDITVATKMATKPEPLAYTSQQIPIRHYGRLVFVLFDQLKTMPAGAERDELTRQTANQMKRDLMLWSHGSADDEKIASDLARFTDGAIQLDLATFKFEKIKPSDLQDQQQSSGKRRRR